MRSYHRTEIGDVIICNQNADEWTGCILIVEEVSLNSVYASLKLPTGKKYIKLSNEQFYHLRKGK